MRAPAALQPPGGAAATTPIRSPPPPAGQAPGTTQPGRAPRTWLVRSFPRPEPTVPGPSAPGPTLLEAVTYRWEGHSKSDRQAYRTREEVKAWQAKDPIPRFGERLMQAGLLTQDEFNAVRDAAYQKIEDAVAYAENSPEPDVANIMDGVYA